MHALPDSFPAMSWTSLDLANHLWQSTVVGVAVLGLLFAARPLSARTRRTLGGMALAKFFLPIAALTRLVALIGGTPDRWLESRALLLPLSPTVFATTTAEPTLNLVGLIIAGVWFTGFVALFGIWITRGISLRRQTLAQARPLSASLAQSLVVASQSIGLKRAPRAYALDENCSPGVLGFSPPVIILPIGLEATLTAEELQSVLIHECVHLQRRDNLLSALQALALSLLWFHPLVWALNRQLNLENEKSCDERVLEITNDADAYAQGIVKCVRHGLGLPQPLLLGVSTPPVLARIKNILAHNSRREQPLARIAVLTTGLLVITLSGHAGTFGRAVEATAPKPFSVAVAEVAAAPVAAPTAPIAEDTVVSRDASAADVVAIASVSSKPEAAPTVAIAASQPDAPAPTLAQSSIETPTLAAPVAVAMAPTENTPVTPAPAAPKLVASSASPSVQSAEVSPKPVASAVPKVKLAAAEPALQAGERVYDVRTVDRMPSPRYQAKPVYPSGMRRSGISGDAVVDFIVDTHGNVVNAYAIRSSRSDFEAPAVAAVSQWKFRPGQKHERDVNTHMQVPIVFQVSND